MRVKFDWYLGAGSEETENIWNSGVLTLDANVLLDLYRYNEKTREDILKAVSFFKDRVWLSGQAAREFFRNRKTVIVSAEKTFREAEAAIADLRKSCTAGRDQLRGHRLVPRDGLEEMAEQLTAAIDTAAKKIAYAKEQQPDYLAEDPILTRILATFDNRVGDEPSPEQWDEIRRIGEARRVAKVPPGYLDDDKEGDRKYGDYLLWRQIIAHARSVSQPMILVTSERKEDWWEKQGGRTVGPRAELLEEAAIESGQRILIYQTDQFLKFALDKIGDQIDASSVDEILQVDAQRTLRASRPNPTAVLVAHEIESDEDDPLENRGIAHIELLRPVPTFTATVRLNPNIDWSEADVVVALTSYPTGSPEVLVRGGVDLNGRLHLHAHSTTKENLPPGNYQIEFEASILERVLRSLTDLTNTSE